MVKLTPTTPAGTRSTLAPSRLSNQRGSVAKAMTFVTDLGPVATDSSGVLNRGTDLRGQVSGTLRQNTVAEALTAPAATVEVSLPKTDDVVLQALKDALSAAGINPSALGLALHSDLEGYPGGTYMNRYISVTTPKGTAGLMTDLVSKSPAMAVMDVKRMLGMA